MAYVSLSPFLLLVKGITVFILIQGLAERQGPSGPSASRSGLGLNPVSSTMLRGSDDNAYEDTEAEPAAIPMPILRSDDHDDDGDAYMM